jgi:16S rRNA (cytidine1402-2'-O)-methyltransferase
MGNYEDITLRAIKILTSCDVLICEERKPAEILFKRIKIDLSHKEVHQLNEHSENKDVKALVSLCKTKTVALISDCGTPAFYDPGCDLVAACYKEGIEVVVCPGASSLMGMISLSGIKLDEFYFVGFLPAETDQRKAKLLSLSKMKIPFVIMDTPYRLNKTLSEVALQWPKAFGVLAADITGPEQILKRGSMEELATQTYPKQPFVLLIKP